MGTSENKTKKLICLVTYAVAVLFLLLGFFLPLFNGKGILALQLPNVFRSLANKTATDLGKPFELNYLVHFMGKGKYFDFMAFDILLYTVVTFVSLIMFIPIGLTFKKQTKIGVIIAYAVEIAAALVLSLYLVMGLGILESNFLLGMISAKISANMLIALCGVLAMLVIQCLVNKKLTGGVKLVLFLLSAFAFLCLFDFWISGKIGDKYWEFTYKKLKCDPLLLGLSDESTLSGHDLLTVFFTMTIKDIFRLFPAAKEKAAVCLGFIVALIVLVNFFIDIIGLATNAKRKGLYFNVARYLLEILAVVALFITAAVCKYMPAFLLCLVLIVAFIQLVISVVRLVLEFMKSKKTADEPIPVEAYFDTPAPDTAAEPAQAQAEPATNEPANNVPFYAENYNASPYPYPPAVYSAPEEPEEDLLADDEEDDSEPEQPVQPVQPAREEQPYTLRDFKPAEEYKPAPTVEPLPDYFKPYQTQQQQRPTPAEIPTHNVYQPYTPNLPDDRAYDLNNAYQGPTDEFMRKLNNNEKKEFTAIFIEKSKGDIGKVPDYVIGGDNKKFFSAVFIYLGRMRSIVSDGLLNKMYKELNMLQ